MIILQGKYLTENELANSVIGKSIEVHKALGPGLLESAYKECLFYTLTKAVYLWKKKNQCR